ncbi:hypothetical protein Rhe02_24530 [Rhizocola hellebori]|uniref:Uncharacterized protein n=1 Tax=Rhizocola hellebori TaxID=1392758 RepID=A0A8J3Q6V2_9ACTN|nr:hypothetical protein Rhe02_24530 [Rhizocola hellebori]
MAGGMGEGDGAGAGDAETEAVDDADGNATGSPLPGEHAASAKQANNTRGTRIYRTIPCAAW